METKTTEPEMTDQNDISSTTTMAPYEIQNINPMEETGFDWNQKCTSNPNLNLAHPSFRATELTFYDDWDLLELD